MTNLLSTLEKLIEAQSVVNKGSWIWTAEEAELYELLSNADFKAMKEEIEKIQAERDRYRLKYDVIRSRYKASRLRAVKYRKALERIAEANLYGRAHFLCETAREALEEK